MKSTTMRRAGNIPARILIITLAVLAGLASGTIYYLEYSLPTYQKNGRLMNWEKPIFDSYLVAANEAQPAVQANCQPDITETAEEKSALSPSLEPALHQPFIRQPLSTAQTPTEPEPEQQICADQLDELKEELAARYASAPFSIAFQSMSDPEVNLFVNVDRSFVAASTYKLFAAYSMFKTGRPPVCLDTMIIDSDNDCPLNFMARYGWGNFTADAHAIGATSSNFAVETRTTARDLMGFLAQIYRGSLLSAADNGRLLGDMTIQRFRDGIPTGVPEAIVADKVGFLDSFLHDAAIIYSPKGDYVLVVLTSGYSWQAIADVAQEIYDKL